MSSKIEYDVGYIFVEITNEGIYLLYHHVAIRILCTFNLGGDGKANMQLAIPHR